MRHLKTTLAVLGAVTRTTSGSALKLQTSSSTNPPLTVNGKGKVTNLNADTVDGLDSAALKNRSYVFTRAVTVRPAPLSAATWRARIRLCSSLRAGSPQAPRPPA